MWTISHTELHTENTSSEHVEDLKGRRMYGEYDNTATQGPLPQVLDQEKGVENVHVMSWPFQ